MLFLKLSSIPLWKIGYHDSRVSIVPPKKLPTSVASDLNCLWAYMCTHGRLQYGLLVASLSGHLGHGRRTLSTQSSLLPNIVALSASSLCGSKCLCCRLQIKLLASFLRFQEGSHTFCRGPADQPVELAKTGCSTDALALHCMLLAARQAASADVRVLAATFP